MALELNSSLNVLAWVKIVQFCHVLLSFLIVCKTLRKSDHRLSVIEFSKSSDLEQNKDVANTV